MSQDLSKVNPYPYSISEYIKRIIWASFRITLWQVLWHRVPVLRMLLLRLFGASVSTSSMAFGSTVILRPWDLTIGKNSALGPRVNVYNLAKIEIGSNTVISQDVYLCGGTHDYRKLDLPLLRKEIKIGSGVWIGAGAFIGPGVSIGDDAVIGARSVVTKNVPSKFIVGGNPAKKIRLRVMD